MLGVKSSLDVTDQWLDILCYFSYIQEYDLHMHR